MSECKIGPSSASYIYTELWDHNETNQQVASYLQGARDKSANKPQIVATYAGDFYQGGDAVTFTIDAGQGGTVTLVTRYARQDDDPAYHQMILDMGQPTQKLIKYVHFDATGSYDTWKEMTETVELTPGVHTISFWVPGDQTYTPVNIDCITSREFNSDSIKLADAAFAANGAHHLELGDYGRMLDNEFFVNSGRSMSMDLQAWIKNYYNISTAYENLLYGDNLTRQDRQVEISTTGVSLPTSTDGAANTIWANKMTSDAGTALHLINLRTNDQDGNDQYWRNAQPSGSSPSIAHPSPTTWRRARPSPRPSSPSARTTTVAARRRSTSRPARMSRDARRSRSTWVASPRGTWWSSLPP